MRWSNKLSMKSKVIFISCLFPIVGLLFPCLAVNGCKKSDTATVNGAAPAAKFRVIGYLPVGGDLVDQASAWYLTKLTHLNIAFVNPDSTGAFAPHPDIKTVADLAHAKGVAVLISIGGGNAPEYLKTMINGANQTRLINALLNITALYGLDGIDVDLEGSFINADYESFVTNLAAALKSKNKLITAAIATVYATSYTNKALTQFDFVNIMSYDRTGPWNPANPGPHAPMSMAVDDLNYWGTTRGLPKTKLTLGLPFYGYGFGVNAPQSISYQDIVTNYPRDWNVDQLTVQGGGIIYYNGAATIKLKTTLALQKAGGVMIWQLLQDASGSLSLLSGIDSVVTLHK